MTNRIIAASSNEHKIKEIQDIMGKFGMDVISRDEAGYRLLRLKRTGKPLKKILLKRQPE